MKVWYKCPNCGKKLARIDDSENIKGVFVRCRNKYCPMGEVEIKNNIESQRPEARAHDARAQSPEPLADTS